jgi:triosephosphate isomerase (TIM)
MTQSPRPVVIAGNWKMYKTIAESVDFIKALVPLVQESPSQVLLAVPFTAIKSAVDEAKGSRITIGAQNMNDASDGAFTGEIAARMLIDVGAEFVILGHSERRHLFKESNTFINRKVKRALSEGLKVILCVGETLDQLDQGKTHEVLKEQLLESLAEVSMEQMKSVTLAYEPVWAVGSDCPATPLQAQEAHHFCRDCIAKAWNPEVAEHLVIQYGGSVKPDNAKELMAQKDIDGLLVGGASLSAETFSKIVNYQD